MVTYFLVLDKVLHSVKITVLPNEKRKKKKILYEFDEFFSINMIF